MRNRAATSIMAGLALAGLVAAPAGAVKPIVETTTNIFSDMDPCTGQMHEFTTTAEVRTIANQKIVVRSVAVEGTTDSGYVAGGAPIRERYFDGGMRVLVSQTFRNPETREAFHVRMRVLVRDEVPVVEFFDMRCVTGPTIYWPEA